MQPEDFVGREAEARALVASVSKGRSCLLVGESGMGKSALLEFVSPLLEENSILISLEKLAPFGQFLRELFEGLWTAQTLKLEGISPKELYSDFEAAKKHFNKLAPNNETKARVLVDSLAAWKERYTPATLVVDDASGITTTMVPWLVHLEQVSTLVLATTPNALYKKGTKRFWKALEEIKLSSLAKREAAALLDNLTERYAVRAEDPQAYRTKVLNAAQGNPGELTRLVKYLSPETLVKSQDLASLGQKLVEREERGIATAPILLALSAFSIAWRYIARARGDVDGYVLAAIVLGLFVIARFTLGGMLRPRKNE